MNVVIRADASQLIGSGHIMRCLTLGKQLRKKYGATVVFVMRDLIGNLIELVKQNGFSIRVLPRRDTKEKLSGYAVWLTVTQEDDAKDTLQAIADVDSIDRLIVDSYALDYTWEKQFRSRTKEIMVIDDLANRKHDCDILLDQNFYLDKDTRYNGLVPAKCQLLLGPEYALLREEFYEVKKHLRQRDGKIKNILVFYGGSDMTNETTKAMKALIYLHNKGDNFTADIVVGLSNPCRCEIEQLCAQYDFLHYYCQVNNMAELMNKADLMLGAGGTTTWERMYMELPALVTAVAENQVQACRDSFQAGIIEYLGISKHVTVEILVKALSNKLRGLK